MVLQYNSIIRVVYSILSYSSDIIVAFSICIVRAMGVCVACCGEHAGGGGLSVDFTDHIMYRTTVHHFIRPTPAPASALAPAEFPAVYLLVS